MEFVRVAEFLEAVRCLGAPARSRSGEESSGHCAVRHSGEVALEAQRAAAPRGGRVLGVLRARLGHGRRAGP
eukprot:3888825-Pyramimonas_sp.AAC.1